MQNVQIKISSHIEQSDNIDDIQEEVNGQWDEQHQILIYKQNGLENVLEINGNKVTINQNNATKLNFEHQKETRSLLSTQYGYIDILVYDQEVNFSLLESNSGILILNYSLRQEVNPLGSFQLKLQFEPIV